MGEDELDEEIKEVEEVEERGGNMGRGVNEMRDGDGGDDDDDNEAEAVETTPITTAGRRTTGEGLISIPIVDCPGGLTPEPEIDTEREIGREFITLELEDVMEGVRK